jgi:hypothetical protein
MKYKLSVLIAAFSLVLGACAAPAPTQSFNEMATSVASTLAAIASATGQAVSPTATLTATLVPSATNTPGPTNTVEPNRISFATGATQGVMTGRVEANQSLSFTASAAQSQVMIAMLSTPAGNAVMEIVGADGTILLAASTGYNTFRSVLPKTQDYFFRVIGGNSAQDFTLSVIFAVPIQFASGQDSATFEGATAGGYAVTYTVYARENEDLHIDLDTDPDDAALTVWGFDDGTPYVRAQNGVTNFDLDLPETQYYIIEVVPQGGRVVDYEIVIEVN